MKITSEKIVYAIVYLPIALLAMIITDFIFYLANKFNNGWRTRI